MSDLGPDTLRVLIKGITMSETPSRINGFAHADAWQAERKVTETFRTTIDNLTEGVARLVLQLQAALNVTVTLALADIAFSEDMTLDVARAKAKRIYEQAIALEDESFALAAWEKPCACGREGSLDHDDFCDPPLAAGEET